jgi:transposase
LVVALAGNKGAVRLQRFANTELGHRALLVMEATGLYGLDLALRLSESEKIELMVANPRAVRNFARAIMQCSKNDQLDAAILRGFAQRKEFQSWARPAESTLALWAIARRLEALTKQSTAEKNRRHAASLSPAIPACVRRSIARNKKFIEREMKQLRREALQLIAGEARLQQRYEQLRSVPGIGENSGIQTLAELLLLEDRDVHQWVAYAGLDPKEHSSGTSLRKYTRISKLGNQRLRCALYMPALVAVARKLLHAIYGMLRTGRSFGSARIYTLPVLALSEKSA